MLGGGHQLNQSVEEERNILWIKSAYREKKSIQVSGKEIGPTAGHGRSLFELVPSKDFVRVRTETAFSSGELTGRQR